MIILTTTPLLSALVFPKLKWLELAGECSVTDKGLAAISDANPRHLQYIVLQGTRATDAGLLQLIDVEALTDIRLGDQTKITDKGIETFRELRGPYLQLPEVRFHRSGGPRDWAKSVDDQRINTDQPNFLRTDAFRYLQTLGISKDLSIRYDKRQERSKRNPRLIEFLIDYDNTLFLIILCVPVFYLYFLKQK